MVLAMSEEVIRFCPRCGGSLRREMLEGKLRPICERCGFIIYLNLKVGVGVLVEKEGRVLLVRRALEPGLGRWCLPAGFVEYDEGPELAAIRECREETGLQVELEGLHGVYYYTHDPRGNGVLILYRAHIVRGEATAGDDAAEVGFFSAAELPEDKDISFRTHRQILAQWKTQPKEGR